MFDFFKKNKDNTNLDAKGLRDEVLQFIKEELQHLDGGEGKGIAALQLYINAAEADRFKFEAALYAAEPEKLKEEVQRIADNFALDLPAEWVLDVSFTTEIPPAAKLAKGVAAGLIIKNALAISTTDFQATAYLKVVNGKAEEETYTLKPGLKRLNIGREKNVQSKDGSFRINEIAFYSDAHDSNKYISRQHAHLEWDAKANAFLLYADEGGVPPANKTKIRSALDGNLHKLNSAEVGYALKNGDQVILGESAVLEFTLVLM